ncbi:MAG: glycosyltransferase involved in cell wall biosynthesis [Cyclobacteriaceae bacterium]|jgi:glycosyltransferase involved in cell wall biosynthesis
MIIGIAINKCWNIFNFRKGLIRSLQAAGHTVVAIAPEDEYVSRVKALGCVFEKLPMSHTGANPLEELLLIARFYKILKRQKIDCLLTFTIKVNIYGTIAARLNKVPIICNVSGLGTAFLANTLSANIARMLSKLFLPLSSHVFFQNTDDQSDFKAKVKLKDSQTSLVPGSGIDLSEFILLPVQSPSKFQFVMLSRLIIEKGVYEFAEAARLVKAIRVDTKFALVGEHDVSHSRSVALKALDAWQQDDLIQYFGHSDDVKTFIADCEALVLPSYREGTPRALLEGAAMGRVLIASDVPGCREVVLDEYNGYLCKAADAKDLASVMIRFLDLSTEAKNTLGQNSRLLVEKKFDEKLVVKSYLDKIQDLVLK